MPYTLLNEHKFKRICNQERFKEANQPRFDRLTRREMEIASLVVQGYKSLQIAEELFISRYTVEQHRKNVNRKLRVHSHSELVQYALAFDLV
ncbi:MAG: helix-turn-helix transcriptional regulator [Reichenbachiella sp.]|uniref:response regulator transcription factor n=1 Tax=Reichenbachiella sp. TaxID=2184521 RepID=UPI00326443EA